LATFFVKKVHNIKTTITAALSEHDPDPLSADSPHDGSWLTKFSPVTLRENRSSSLFYACQLSPLDFVPTSVMKACSFSYFNESLLGHTPEYFSDLLSSVANIPAFKKLAESSLI